MDWRDAARTYGRGLGATAVIAVRAFVAYLAALFLIGLASIAWRFLSGGELPNVPRWVTVSLALAIWLPLASIFWPALRDRNGP